jgi:hypothetical protein
MLATSAQPVLRPEDSTGLCYRNGIVRVLFILSMEVDEAQDRIWLFGGDNDKAIVRLTLCLSQVVGGLISVE